MPDFSAAGAPRVTHDQMANAIRFLAVDAVEQATCGHPGMPMGMADVATVLFTKFLKYDPKAPHWPDRDRFVLSAGHGSMLLYALLHLTGYPGVTLEEIKRFRQLGSKTPGHPEYGHTAGVETTTGPLGQGLATSVGMAIAERMLEARFGPDLVDHHTYVIAGDGCLMEGISHEAIDLAGHLKLGRLIVFWDDNRITIDGPTSLSTSTDQVKRFAASGWHTQAIDGHDPAAIARAIRKARNDPRPSMIACRTTIGFGAPTKAGTEGAHGAALGAAEIAGARAALGWPHGPFEIPANIAAAWRRAGRSAAKPRAAWEARLAASTLREGFEAALSGEPAKAGADLLAYAAELVETRPNIATRKASENTLTVINAATDLTIGGSADLTHSNYTITKGMTSLAPGDFSGRYIRYGIREHGMAAAMNGIALHGGFIPYGGAFLVFADYARGAIRLSALMKQRVIYVLTHDSIGVGEDGPTHQPVEHLATLRSLPGLITFRPADAVETAECYASALAERHAPSAFALSRQNLPTLRLQADGVNHSARGAYVLREARGQRQATLLATGSEVHLAVAAAEALAAEGVHVAVVSMPSWTLFERQSEAYRAEVLGSAPRIAIEAAVRFGWDRWIGPEGVFIGMTGFGESAPAPELYRHFGITTEAIAAAARKVVCEPLAMRQSA
jgi:transketolase